MAIPWITTPLASGPIPANNYNCTIGGLSGNSIYEYRAYMVVDGMPYYGNVLTIYTLASTNQTPLVTTGNAGVIALESMRITGNTVDDKGIPSIIDEYGVLYTQNSSFGTENNLRFACTGVSKKSICNDIGIGVEYFSDTTHDLTPLLQNTTTYYRAFAKNGDGIGYGAICTEQTLASSQSLIYLSGVELNMVDTCVCACAKIGVEPPLTGGQSFRLCYSNYACSISDGDTRQMRACTHAEQGTTPVAPSTAISIIYDNPNGYTECISEASGYFDVNASNINNFTFFTEACSHAINSVANNTNCSVICLGNIVNQNGASFTLANEESTYMKVYTMSLDSPNQSSGGHIPTLV